MASLEIDRIDVTRVIYFDSPPANGLNLELVEELDKAIGSLEQESSQVRSLILASFESIKYSSRALTSR